MTRRRTWRDWLAAIWFAQHNARVIADFEDRMSSVIHDATMGRMSKPYYDAGAMLQEISEAYAEHGRENYEDGRRDAFEEMGETDPQTSGGEK